MKLLAPVILKPRSTVLREIAVAEIDDVVDDCGIAGRLPIGDVGVGRGQDHVAVGLQRDPVVPGVEPDQRLTLRLRPVGAGMHDDPLVPGILRRRLQRVLDAAAGMDVVAGGPGSGRPGVHWSGSLLAGQGTHRQSSQRGEHLQYRAAIRD